jgi:hypothetical protein
MFAFPHARSSDEAQMTYSQSFRHEKMLARDHVAISISRKILLQSVARFARVAMADRVRQNDEVFFDIEGTPTSEQRIRHLGLVKLYSAPGRAVQQKHCVAWPMDA